MRDHVNVLYLDGCVDVVYGEQIIGYTSGLDSNYNMLTDLLGIMADKIDQLEQKIRVMTPAPAPEPTSPHND